MHNYPIYRVALYQSLLWLIMFMVAITTLGKVSGYSVALGGLISLLPGIYFMFRYFLVSGARAMEQVVKNAYIAEAIKLGLISLGFMTVFKLVSPLSPASVFGGFLVMHVAGLVVSASKINDKRK